MKNINKYNILKHLNLSRPTAHPPWNYNSYLFEFLDEPSSFNATLHVEADVHFDFSERVGQFDDGNLWT